jgi:hypothetical protein
MSYGSIPKASLKWDTSYLDYVIISYTGNTTSTSTTIYSTSILDGSYTSHDLSFNTKYTFLLTPYYNGNMGAIKTMIMDTTPPIAGVYSDSISTSSSVQLNWVTSNYNYVKISRSTQNGTYVDISSIVIGSQYFDKDISGNGTYNYKITPYMDGIPYSTSSPITVYTNIQSPANLTISSYDSSSVTVSFIEPKNYYTSSAVYTVYTTDASANGTSSPLIISGLTANTSYNIFGNVVLDGTNAAAMTGNVMITTYGIINTVTTSASTMTTITLSITGLYNTYNLYYSSNSGSSYSTFGTGFSSSTPQVTGLTANTGYLFKLTPYNGASTVGRNFITSTKYYTLPTISVFSLNTTNSTSVVFNINGYYTTALIYYGTSSGSILNSSTVSTANSGVLTTCTVSGLIGNTTYYFNVYPVNSAEAQGSSPTEVSVTTTGPYSITGSGSNTIDINGSTHTITFTSGSNTFIPGSTITSNVLIVAGGGGGGYGSGLEGAGGGGGGGVGIGTINFLSSKSYTITVGNGGVGGFTYYVTSGYNSSISGDIISETSYGGGKGGSGDVNTSWSGTTGGSGGGGTGWGGTHTGSAATTGKSSSTGNTSMIYYGYSGGSGISGGGGGGGANGSGEDGSSGTTGTSIIGGVGGTGIQWSINSVYYGGGGGGGSYYLTKSAVSTTSVGGGGSGGGSGPYYPTSIIRASSGTANTGGGGGGAGASSYGNAVGGNGGSGIIIIVFTL